MLVLHRSQSGGWEEMDIPLTEEKLLEMREVARAAWNDYIAKTPDWMLGNVPRTITKRFLEDAGYKIPNNLDGLLIVYSCYMDIKIGRKLHKCVFPSIAELK